MRSHSIASFIAVFYTPLATVLLLLPMCCAKDAEVLPVAPAGKVVASINGETFEAEGSIQVDRRLVKLTCTSGNRTFSITLRNGLHQDSYDLGESVQGATVDAQFEYTDQQGNYTSSRTPNGRAIGTLVITQIDQSRQVASGTFSGRLTNVAFVNTNSAKVIEIVNGSFTSIPYTMTNVNKGNRVTATIDDKNYFTADMTIATDNSRNIEITATSLNGGDFVLTMPNTIVPRDEGKRPYGLHAFGTDTFALHVLGNTWLLSEKGTLKIHLHDTRAKRIEGEFSFNCASVFIPDETHVVTNGTFAVTYH